MISSLDVRAARARLGAAVLSRTPASLVERASRAVLALLTRRHPTLFEAIAKLPAATVRVEPTDLPHRFRLGLGGGLPFTLRVEGPGEVDARAAIKGPLEPLLDLLEGRLDGDALFFGRQLTLTGDISVVMGLRNTMDREELDLTEDLLSALGPLTPTASRLVHALQRRLAHPQGAHA